MPAKSLSIIFLLNIAALPATARADGGANRTMEVSQRHSAESATKPGRDEFPPRGARRSPGKALPPRGGKAPSNAEQQGKARPMSAASSLFTGLASLAVVLGMFFAVAWAMRRGMPAGAAALPKQAVEVLGRTALAGRQYAHLVRCGNKILLVYLAPGVAKTLTEITYPAEVDRLAGLCRQDQPTSANASLRRILQQFGREKSGAGLLGRQVAPLRVDVREGADA